MNSVISLTIIFTILIFVTQPVFAVDRYERTEVQPEEIRLLKELILDMKTKFDQENALLKKEIQMLKATYKDLITGLNDKILNLE